ncbi:N-acyl-D-glucosamine 2-epimerase [Runella rosea]|uniref:Cellobiose 2-epimerase n=1 Tax=Runella rosea TaxID=2259595 RepID=A0A344TG34_9BACT|nr:AGE family epimerase/isomerase [Runella rosea]AXE17605.1 N-acyl-D-glucosamine 2-epimerase [Runella rosea]
MNHSIFDLKQEIQVELSNILAFWATHSLDDLNGGFIGKMDFDGIVHPEVDKSSVLNARILWTFSAVLNQPFLSSGKESTEGKEFLSIANRAFHYINQHFRDTVHGGVYWSVDAHGKPLSTRKQIYGLAFTMYGLTEYYRATRNQQALNFAIELFELIENHSFDPQNGGYWEAFTQDWELLEDLRLSEKDRNDPKTMNTHLHIIEAYVNLYRVWPNAQVEAKIRHLLDVFEKHIIEAKSGHMQLFFDAQWTPTSDTISFGHDIEASWLLYEATEVLHNETLLKKWKSIALRMADAAAQGFNEDGSLNHEFDPQTNHWDTHREWWVSAEGMVGYFNAFQLSGEERYLRCVEGLWQFAKKHLINAEIGEWNWGVYDDMSLMHTEDRIGFWKCPYHNARACMEILKRI